MADRGTELYDHARANGVTFRYLTFDEGYGGKPEFLRQLAAREQLYVAEVPRTVSPVGSAPSVRDRSLLIARHGRGRGRAVPRLDAGQHGDGASECRISPPLDAGLERPGLDASFRIKDTQKGPMVWEVKHVMLVPKDENGLPAEPLHLILARNVRDVLAVKFFVSNRGTRYAGERTLARVAFSPLARGTLFRGPED